MHSNSCKGIRNSHSKSPVGYMTAKRKHYIPLVLLVIAGEVIFALPFHVPRYFRPSLLESLSITNTQLGDAFAIYGITALLCYFPGGWLADRFDTRSMLCLSLFLTAAGGLFLGSFPNPTSMLFLYGYWGTTTILLFWAALIRTTREWAKASEQGIAFGFLDGGRGLIAAIFATIAVFVFAYFSPDSSSEVSERDPRKALEAVIFAYTLVTFLTAILVWFFMPTNDSKGETNSSFSLSKPRFESPKPSVLLIALVILCAYTGYKGIDNTALYLYDVLHFTDKEAAYFAALGTYLRPVSAVLAGFIADKVAPTKTIFTLFAVLGAAYTAILFATPSSAAISVIVVGLIVSFTAVFALRGVYFALLEESNITKNETGIVVGVVSVIGYSPDIFFGPISGRILDASPGVAGHQAYFLLLTCFAVVGLCGVWLLINSISKQRTKI